MVLMLLKDDPSGALIRTHFIPQIGRMISQSGDIAAFSAYDPQLSQFLHFEHVLAWDNIIDSIDTW